MYRKSRRMKALERKRQRCAAMREAKERKRLSETFNGPDWIRVWTMIVGVYAHRDGRHVGIWLNGKPWKFGSERAVRGKLARMLYGNDKKGKS